MSTSPPSWGFIRLKALLAPIGPLPFGRSTFLRGVKEGRFPDDEHSYSVDDKEFEKFLNLVECRRQM